MCPFLAEKILMMYIGLYCGGWEESPEEISVLPSGTKISQRRAAIPSYWIMNSFTLILQYTDLCNNSNPWRLLLSAKEKINNSYLHFSYQTYTTEGKRRLRSTNMTHFFTLYAL